MSNVDKSLYSLNDVFKRLGEDNIWVELSSLAKENKAVDLSQGYPDYDSLGYLNQIIQKTLIEDKFQLQHYTRSLGHLRLVESLGKLYSKLLNRTIDPLDEILITVGADGSLFNAFTSFLNRSPDDEVIIIEPFYDAYVNLSVISNANKIKFVPLRPRMSSSSSRDWCWDEKELENAFTHNTRLLVVNNPNNPLGKVYSREELEKLASLCLKYNVLCISDEVYEHIFYEKQHIRIATLPGMWQRTVTIGSAGKTFSSTGVKIGWTIGPKELVKLCEVVHTNSFACCATFFQEVIARSFELELSRLYTPECYFNSLARELKPKRDRLAELLKQNGLKPIVPEGGYCMLVDISHLANDFRLQSTYSNESIDRTFVKYLIKEKGLATMPSTIFFSSENKKIGENYIRLCFFKNDDTLEKAATILKTLNKMN